MIVIRFDHPLVTRSLRIIREKPNGISRAELAPLLGVNLDKASRILYCLGQMHLVKFKGRLWFADEANEELIEAGKQKIRAINKCRDIKRNAARTAARKKARAEAQAQAQRKSIFVVNAPNSVWQLQYFV